MVGTKITTKCKAECGSTFETYGMTHAQVRADLQEIGWLTLNGDWFCQECKAVVRPVSRDV